MFGNWIKTTILMAGIVALFGAMGAAIGGQIGKQGRRVAMRCGQIQPHSGVGKMTDQLARVIILRGRPDAAERRAVQEAIATGRHPARASRPTNAAETNESRR